MNEYRTCKECVFHCEVLNIASECPHFYQLTKIEMMFVKLTGDDSNKYLLAQKRVNSPYYAAHKQEIDKLFPD